MTDKEQAVSAERLREIIAGCEGVTPGPWHMYGEPEVGMMPEPFSGSVGKGDMEPVYRSSANLHHIARLDPVTVKAMAELALSTVETKKHFSTPDAPLKNLMDWVNQGPDLAKAASVYVGIKIYASEDAAQKAGDIP